MTLRLSPGPLAVATHNAGKIREILAMLQPYGVGVKSASELNLPEPEETGSTFAENAILKARAAAEASGLVALADDFGARGRCARWRSRYLLGALGRPG